MKRRERVAPAEMEVLRYVSQNHPVTVRQAAEHFAAASGWARTTVLTVMERLRRKGYLTRRKEAGVNEYSPAEPGPELMRGLVGEFVQKALGGSVSPFVAYLARDAELSEQEVAELKRLVRGIEAREQAAGPAAGEEQDDE